MSIPRPRKRNPTTQRATPPTRRTAILCPTCKQDMLQAPHKGLIDCAQCGQGTKRRPLDQLIQLTVRARTMQTLGGAHAKLLRAERLVAKWRRGAELPETAGVSSWRSLHRCANQLERLLKP